jgi:hypothetical protein
MGQGRRRRPSRGLSGKQQRFVRLIAQGVLALPPTITPRGPITWIRAPHEDSLHLSREIDVFGALRAILGDSHR